MLTVSHALPQGITVTSGIGQGTRQPPIPQHQQQHQQQPHQQQQHQQLRPPQARPVPGALRYFLPVVSSVCLALRTSHDALLFCGCGRGRASDTCGGCISEARAFVSRACGSKRAVPGPAGRIAASRRSSRRHPSAAARLADAPSGSATRPAGVQSWHHAELFSSVQ